jgi:hypothetical protein
MQRNRTFWCILVLLLAAFPASAFAKLAVLAEGIDLAAPLSASSVLCSTADNQLALLSLPDGERQPWPGGWDAQAAGWESTGRIATLCVSPDLQWVCYSTEARLPDSYALKFDGMRTGLAVILACADGSGAKCVALSIEVGGGPEFAFTQNSARLVGSPFLPCPTTPQGYADYINADMAARAMPEFNYIDTATGKTGAIPDLQVGDGFWKCPYSDNFRIENNWYAEHNFSSFATGGLTGTFKTGEEVECRLYSWVLPDALLIEFDGITGLLYTDGEFHQAPQAGLQVYCWLPDGTYLLRENADGPVLHARMDWGAWQVTDAQPVPDYPELDWPTVIPLPDSNAVLINQYGPGVLQLLPLK